MTNARKTLLLFVALIVLAIVFEVIGLSINYPFTYLAQDASRAGVAALCLPLGFILGHLFWGRTKEDRVTQHMVGSSVILLTTVIM